ncbi:class I SAM-dependent methyltransferase [Desulfuromonas sp. CSMB_57]|jgi:ubiquinone/menaquinone biosynthesis C-methylase UbiE|uniref:class I SAM-dependent methyltransferase n=1 Tax=Desulfuromonas sp. CSMB_57 TaxID=2807629 RepID=UPI001CD4B2B3|nr:class I SAM-dependent methyltransferase [Desulfuromonas sp. CSMB_57]
MWCKQANTFSASKHKMVRADVARLPFVDAAFVIINALHHFGRQTESMAEVARILAPGFSKTEMDVHYGISPSLVFRVAVKF